MKLLAIAATSSKHSINKQLLKYGARLIEEGLIPGATVKRLDLNDYEMPIYSIDRQNADGIPEAAHRFFEEIRSSDGILLSFAEHNGSYTAAYKNVFDWASRIQMRVYQDKPTVVFATSIGPGGGASVLKTAVESAPFFGNDLKASMAIPSFSSVFDSDSERLTNSEIDRKFQEALRAVYRATVIPTQ